jgi:hypothetical protein
MNVSVAVIRQHWIAGWLVNNEFKVEWRNWVQQWTSSPVRVNVLHFVETRHLLSMDERHYHCSHFAWCRHTVGRIHIGLEINLRVCGMWCEQTARCDIPLGLKKIFSLNISLFSAQVKNEWSYICASLSWHWQEELYLLLVFTWYV